MKPLLIVVSSPQGSTREIAGHLREAFEAVGRPVDVCDLEPVNVEAFAAVVVAAPVHGMRWLPEAAAWTAEHREGLRSRPAALVAVSYLYFEGRSGWKASIARALETVRAPLPHASVQFFGGRLRSPLPAPARWLFGVAPNRPLDLVDPSAVKAWAQAWVKTIP